MYENDYYTHSFHQSDSEDSIMLFSAKLSAKVTFTHK